MRDRFRLASLGNAELLASLAAIVQADNSLTADLLAHLAECDERRLHLDVGFPSLFAYCTESLGFCESKAGRRITAARVCRQFPEAFALVADGKLHLSALCSLKHHLTADNARELFDMCTHKSAREVEKLLAARFPRPDVQDSIRRLPIRPATASDAGGAPGALQATDSAPGSSAGIGSRAGAPMVPSPATTDDGPRGSDSEGGPAPASRSRRFEPLSADRFAVRFTSDSEFCDLLERVRGLAAHRLPTGDLLTLLKRGLEAYERELKKERFGIGRRPRADLRRFDGITSIGPAPDSVERATPGGGDVLDSAPRSRYVAAAVRREVYTRDEGQCTFISPDGRRCGARRRLELDHIEPWAVGGKETVKNLRLRCSAHNLRHAERCFGTARIRAALSTARGQEGPKA